MTLDLNECIQTGLTRSTNDIFRLLSTLKMYLSFKSEKSIKSVSFNKIRRDLKYENLVANRVYGKFFRQMKVLQTDKLYHIQFSDIFAIESYGTFVRPSMAYHHADEMIWSLKPSFYDSFASYHQNECKLFLQNEIPGNMIPVNSSASCFDEVLFHFDVDRHRIYLEATGPQLQRRTLAFLNTYDIIGNQERKDVVRIDCVSSIHLWNFGNQANAYESDDILIERILNNNFICNLDVQIESRGHLNIVNNEVSGKYTYHIRNDSITNLILNFSTSHKSAFQLQQTIHVVYIDYELRDVYPKSFCSGITCNFILYNNSSATKIPFFSMQLHIRNSIHSSPNIIFIFKDNFQLPYNKYSNLYYKIDESSKFNGLDKNEIETFNTYAAHAGAFIYVKSTNRVLLFCDRDMSGLRTFNIVQNDPELDYHLFCSRNSVALQVSIKCNISNELDSCGMNNIHIEVISREGLLIVMDGIAWFAKSVGAELVLEGSLENENVVLTLIMIWENNKFTTKTLGKIILVKAIEKLRRVTILLEVPIYIEIHNEKIAFSAAPVQIDDEIQTMVLQPESSKRPMRYSLSIISDGTTFYKYDTDLIIEISATASGDKMQKFSILLVEFYTFMGSFINIQFDFINESV